VDHLPKIGPSTAIKHIIACEHIGKKKSTSMLLRPIKIMVEVLKEDYSIESYILRSISLMVPDFLSLLRMLKVKVKMEKKKKKKKTNGYEGNTTDTYGYTFHIHHLYS
jgi:hypothetical protein